MKKPRFEVCVTHGDRTHDVSRGNPKNACAYVYDRLRDCMVESYVTEGEQGRPGFAGRKRRSIPEVTRLATERCAELNAKYPTE